MERFILARTSLKDAVKENKEKKDKNAFRNA